MREVEREPESRITRTRTRYLRPRLRGLWSGAAITAGVASLFLIAGVAQAAPVTLLPPYTAIPVLNAPITWNTGTGFIKWPTAVNSIANTGKAGYDVWARSIVSLTGGTHGSDNTQAGFNITEICGACVGDTAVDFTWSVTWNATMDLTCTGGSVNNQFGIDEQIYDHTGASLGFQSLHIFWQSASTTPTHTTGGATNKLYTVSVATGLLGAGTYYLHGWLFSEVYTMCPTGTPGLPYSNSELYVATGGAGATLTQVLIH